MYYSPQLVERNKPKRDWHTYIGIDHNERIEEIRRRISTAFQTVADLTLNDYFLKVNKILITSILDGLITDDTKRATRQHPLPYIYLFLHQLNSKKLVLNLM